MENTRNAPNRLKLVDNAKQGTPFVFIYPTFWVKLKSNFIKFDQVYRKEYEHTLYQMRII